MTYAEVEQAFEDAYQELRTQTRENAPSSFTWYAPTLESLAEESGDMFDAEGSRYRREIGDGETVAYVFECNGSNLVEIKANADPDAVAQLMAEFLNLAS